MGGGGRGVFLKDFTKSVSLARESFLSLWRFSLRALANYVKTAREKNGLGTIGVRHDGYHAAYNV